MESLPRLPYCVKSRRLVVSKCQAYEEKRKSVHHNHTHLITSPVVPLMEMISPALKILSNPFTVTVSFISLTDMAEHPHTQGFPHPLATTAAWLVMPPLAVKIPDAVDMIKSSVQTSSVSRNSILVECLN